MRDKNRPVFLRLLLNLSGVLLGLAVAVLDFFASTLFYNLTSNTISVYRMLPAAIVGFILSLALIFLLFFFLKKRSKSFAVSFLITGTTICIVVLIYLGSIKFYL